MQFIAANWQAPSHVKAFTSTRIAGVSEPPYDSFNFGAHVGDHLENVQHNRQLLINNLNLPSQPNWLEQVHGTDIITINKPLNTPVQADGAYSTTKEIICSILTADCLPLFITNDQGSKIALLHVGWRGLADGIIEQGIAKFEQPGDQLIAYAGPCISLAAFEISDMQGPA